LTEIHPDSAKRPPTNTAAPIARLAIDRLAPCFIRMRGFLAARVRLVNLVRFIADARFQGAERN
jgi:hypothetical protein